MEGGGANPARVTEGNRGAGVGLRGQLQPLPHLSHHTIVNEHFQQNTPQLREQLKITTVN